MTEKEKTAYHEAGHGFKAFKESILGFGSVCIYQEGEAWVGNTEFKRSRVSARGRAVIAVAGVIAEAKAVASEEEPRNVNCNEILRNRILELIEEELPKPEDQQEEHVWPLHVPVQGAAPVIANFTRADLEGIPPASHTEERISEALTAAVEMVNDPINWAAITDLAAELHTFGPKCLIGYRVYCIIKEATQALIDELED